jgi:hypothetical protein
VKKYEIISRDGERIGNIDGDIYPDGIPDNDEPMLWDHIVLWPHFQGYSRTVIGTWRFRTMSFPHGLGCDIRYDMGSVTMTVASIVPLPASTGVADGRCKKCFVAGRFIRAALMCPLCHAFLGGI